MNKFLIISTLSFSITFSTFAGEPIHKDFHTVTKEERDKMRRLQRMKLYAPGAYILYQGAISITPEIATETSEMTLEKILTEDNSFESYPVVAQQYLVNLMINHLNGHKLKQGSKFNQNDIDTKVSELEARIISLNEPEES